MKKILVTVLVIAAVATLVNDIGRYGKAYYDVDVIGRDTATTVALQNKTNSRDANARLAAEYAAVRGATVYLYDQNEEQVRVWVEMPVTGTWLLRRIMAAQDSESQDGTLKVQAEHRSNWKS